MSLLVSALEIYMPNFVKKRALTQLFYYTAAAFDAQVPSLAGFDSQECLAQYAHFVQTHAEERLRDGLEVDLVAQHLYKNAVEMSQPYGKLLRLGTVSDVMAIGRVLYRILNIDLQGDAQGEIVINHCYFSRYYSAGICRLMSAMDCGMFAGLSNGGKLTFISRITEGQPCCRAHFSWEPKTVNKVAKA